MNEVTHDTIQPAQRVRDHENARVDGNAFVSKRSFEDHLEKTKTLRAQQEAYFNSLPNEPAKALSAILTSFNEVGDLDGPGYAPRASLVLLRELVAYENLSESADVAKAIYWLTSQALDGLDQIDERIERARDTALQLNPHNERFEA